MFPNEQAGDADTHMHWKGSSSLRVHTNASCEACLHEPRGDRHHGHAHRVSVDIPAPATATTTSQSLSFLHSICYYTGFPKNQGVSYLRMQEGIP